MPRLQGDKPVTKKQYMPSPAVMASRNEPKDSLDDFPTRPWATRALIEHLPASALDLAVWEPMANRGFMARPLEEQFSRVIRSDVFDYGQGDHIWDFLTWGPAPPWAVGAGWIIMNPPFNVASECILQAIRLATHGVAAILRTNFVEGANRYESLFRDHPPTQILFFCERVPMHRGRIVIDGATAMSYSWFIWEKGVAPKAPAWIPPGTRARLTLPGDYDHEMCWTKERDALMQAETGANLF